MSGLIRPKTVPNIETAAGIPIDLEIEPRASCTVLRGSMEVDQTVQRPTTAMLVVGARLYHKADHQTYEITDFKNQLFTIKRLKDDSEHAATLRQLKSHTWIITERLKGTG